MIWGDTVAYWARWQGDAVAIRFGDRELTWRELSSRADRVAAGLAQLGVGHGDRVGLLMSNRPEFIEVYVAAARLGAIVAPFNLRFTPHELAFVVDNADGDVVVTESALAGGLSLAAEQRALTVIDVDGGSYTDLMANDGTFAAPHVDPDDPWFICFTSGTTGDPKGAVLTHQSWFYASMVRALQGGINRNDRILLPFPLAFTGGLALSMVALWSGATLVLEPAFEPGRALHLIETQRITVFMAVPTLVPDDEPAPRLRRDRHLVDPVRELGWRDRADPAAAHLSRPRHHDDPDVLAHRGERVGHHPAVPPVDGEGGFVRGAGDAQPGAHLRSRRQRGAARAPSARSASRGPR